MHSLQGCGAPCHRPHAFTMDANDSTIPDTLRSQAAYWFTRMQSGEITRDEQAAFRAWHDSDPLHARAYRHASFAWDASLAIPEQKLRAILRKKEVPARPLLNRRNFGFAAAGTCAALVLLAVNTRVLSQGEAQYTLTLNTKQGERSTFELPDGTVVYANTATQATVTYYETQRTVQLASGEVFLDVAHDSSRPFIVQAQLGEVLVTGTRFNVRNDITALDVSVVSGSVNVSTGSWMNRSTRTLTQGMQVSISDQEKMSDTLMVDAATVTAWQRGRIVVENMPLAQVVKELNRYLPMPALLNAPRLNQYKVTGTFDADHPQSMLNALPMIAPVNLYQLTDGRYRIVER
jgi:transmembrane sensor